MSQIGSFALLLALALSAYSFLAGVLALARPGPGSERLGETARRAGIATFAVVFLAAVVLVISAFQDDFSIAYIFHHSNRDLPAPYKFATLWSGQEGSLLFWSLLLAAYGLVLRLRHKTDSRLFALRLGHHRRGAGFLPAAAEFRRPSFRAHAGRTPRRRQRAEPAAAISRDGDPPAHALSGICGLHRSLRLRAGRADHALSRARSGSTSLAAGPW